MAPGFDPDVTAYTAATTDATNTINATPEDSEATVTLYLAGEPTASPVTWATGENELRVEVKSDSGVKSYTIIVTKS